MEEQVYEVAVGFSGWVWSRFQRDWEVVEEDHCSGMSIVCNVFLLARYPQVH